MLISKIVLVIFLLLGLYLTLEIIKRYFGLNTKLTRKTAHIVSGAVCVWLFYFFSFLEYTVAVLFFFLFFGIARRYWLLSSIHLKERITYGEVYYPLGILATIFLAYGNKFVAVS